MLSPILAFKAYFRPVFRLKMDFSEQVLEGFIKSAHGCVSVSMFWPNSQSSSGFRVPTFGFICLV
jgi:hypothetical protein